MGIADTENTEMPPTLPSKMEIEEIYEEIDQEHIEVNQNSQDNIHISLTEVKGVGKGTAKSLESEGIKSINQLIECDPEETSKKISGVSPKMLIEWQEHAKELLN